MRREEGNPRRNQLSRTANKQRQLKHLLQESPNHNIKSLFWKRIREIHLQQLPKPAPNFFARPIPEVSGAKYAPPPSHSQNPSVGACVWPRGRPQQLASGGHGCGGRRVRLHRFHRTGGNWRGGLTACSRKTRLGLAIRYDIGVTKVAPLSVGPCYRGSCPNVRPSLPGSSVAITADGIGGSLHTATFLRSGKVANNGAACSAGMKWLHQPIQLHSA